VDVGEGVFPVAGLGHLGCEERGEAVLFLGGEGFLHCFVESRDVGVGRAVEGGFPGFGGAGFDVCRVGEVDFGEACGAGHVEEVPFVEVVHGVLCGELFVLVDRADFSDEVGCCGHVASEVDGVGVCGTAEAVDGFGEDEPAVRAEHAEELVEGGLFVGFVNEDGTERDAVYLCVLYVGEIGRASVEELAAVEVSEVGGDVATDFEEVVGDVREDDLAVWGGAFEDREAEETVTAADIEYGVAGLEGGLIEECVACFREPGEGFRPGVGSVAVAAVEDPFCPVVFLGGGMCHAVEGFLSVGRGWCGCVVRNPRRVRAVRKCCKFLRVLGVGVWRGASRTRIPSCESGPSARMQAMSLAVWFFMNAQRSFPIPAYRKRRARRVQKSKMRPPRA